MTKASVLVLLATLSVPIAAEAAPTQNGRWLNTEVQNGRWLNGRWLNGRWLNTANLNASNGGSTFYNPWTGETLPSVYLDKSSFVSSSWECDSNADVPTCWRNERRGDAFVGTWTTATLSDGDPSWTYIAGRWNPNGDQETYLYWVYAWTQDEWQNWTWLPVCADANGQIQPAIPLSGAWDATGARTSYGGNQFTWACTTGALGKCAATLGYTPWEYGLYYEATQSPYGHWYYPFVDGQRSHQACTRMIRADYCGDGESHTYNGNAIDVRDYLLGGQTDVYTGMGGNPTWAAEALWNEDGAAWVSCQRVAGMGQPVTCSNGHHIRNNTTNPQMCFAWEYLPTPEDVAESEPSSIPAFQIDPGELLLGTRTGNLWAQ